MAGPRAAGKAAGHTITVSAEPQEGAKKDCSGSMEDGSEGRRSPLEQADQKPIFELSGNLWHICVPGNKEIDVTEEKNWKRGRGIEVRWYREQKEKAGGEDWKHF